MSNRTAVIPPQNLDAEEDVLGACMLTTSAADRAIELLEPQHFYREAHGAIFEAVRSLRADGKQPDAILVTAELDAMGKLEQTGGRARVHVLAALVPAAGNVAHKAGLVYDAWIKRELIRTLGQASQPAWNGAPAREALQLAETGIVELVTRIERGHATQVVSGERLARSFEAKMANPPDPRGGVPTPFRFVDPLQAGRVYVLAGYTADGKTALSLQFLREAVRERKKVGFVSVEMGWEDVRDRLIAGYGVPYQEVASGRVSPPHLPLVTRALSEMRASPFDVIDDEAVDAAAIARYQRVHRYELLIIDHLHRFDWAERRDLERTMRAITNVARSAPVAVILLAQISRAGGEFPRPTLAAIRESGMIEAEAAAVWFIWRKRDEDKLPSQEAEFIVAKNRFGMVGRFRLHFRPEVVQFVPVVGKPA